MCGQDHKPLKVHKIIGLHLEMECLFKFIEHGSQRDAVESNSTVIKWNPIHPTNASAMNM